MSAMLHILDADIHLIDLETRLPFKYGIATMTSAPHAFVRVRLEVDGKLSTGISADHLPPKWFTKVPEKPLDDEIDEMLQVIEHAVDVAQGLQAATVFELWQELDEQQEAWARRFGFPPLLSHFGTSLVERAMIEAFARSSGRAFPQLARENALGICLDEFDPRLAGHSPGDLLPAEPRESVIARHTVGMADPLTEEEIADDERLDDGLPQSLAECIRRYGLQHFKIKVSGQVDADLERLGRVSQVIAELAPRDFAFTLDGNEQFRSLEGFQEFWQTITRQKDLQSFLGHLMFVEQPFHRDIALDADVLGELPGWADRPPMIIDESDAGPNSVERALALGYNGTSHKNCKGVIRGIAHACLLEALRRDEPEGRFIMSGEDLANIGPVALQQDLAVAATLGVASVERNGHHYFAGLSEFPHEVQRQVLEAHPDLFRQSESGWPTLDVRDGRLQLGSVLSAPFGVGFELDVEDFTPSDEWRRSAGL